MYDSLWKIVPPTKIPNTQFTLTGYSRAAKNTCFYIPEMKVMLDAGIEHDYIPDHVFITHCHSDHSKNIPQCIIQICNFKSKNRKKVNVYVPIEMVNKVRNYIDSFYVMSKNNPNQKSALRYNLIGVQENTRINITIRNIDYVIEIIKCHHTVPCVGYGFIEVRKRLKLEYNALSKSELITLKKSGVEISETYEHPQFCYLGDTTEKVFEDTPTLTQKYNFIMVECSFITKDQSDHALQKGHTVIDNLEPIIIQNSDKTFLLYHFSDRYERDEIVNFFEGKDYKNIIVWI